jgi:hypothetical protein
VNNLPDCCVHFCVITEEPGFPHCCKATFAYGNTGVAVVGSFDLFSLILA